jgi:CRP-like cAMP-binding protein
MFGFDFFLDNQLSIQHRPPPKLHPTWQRFREDVFRLLYSKAKLDGQTEQVNMTIVEAEDFDPYPGEFLKDTLEDKILKTNLILALDYLANDQVEDARETIRNIWLAKTKAIPQDNPFEAYLSFQRRWRALRKLTSRELQAAFLEILSRGDIRLEEERLKEKVLRAEFERKAGTPQPMFVDHIPLFIGLPKEQVETLLSLSDRAFFAKDEVLIEEGSEEHVLYVITKGAARILLSGNDEETRELIEVGEGETLGEVSLLIDAPHSATVVATEPTEVLAFSRVALSALMADYPDLAAILWHRLAVSLGNRLRNTNERYIGRARETYDVSDELLGTRPFEEPQGDTES